MPISIWPKSQKDRVHSKEISKLPIVQPWLPLPELPPAKRLGKYQLKPTPMELKASFYRIGLDLQALIAVVWGISNCAAESRTVPHDHGA